MGKKEKFFKTKLTELPKYINTKGKSYKLDSSHGNSKTFGEWWSFKYTDNDEPEQLPIQASDGGSIYYLCSMEDTEEEAKDDMLKRLNTMVEIMTQEDIKEQSRLWKKRMEKLKKK